MKSNLRALWASAGGNAPEHWEFKTVEDLLEHSKSISVGVMYPGQNSDGGIPLIKVSDVKNGAIAAKPEFCVSAEVDEEYKRTRLNGSELLITLVGNPGDCVVATEEMAGWNAARALAVVRLADIELRSWLRYVLLSRPAKHLIGARLNTTVQKTLNLKDIRELGLPIPPKEEREGITKIIDAIERKILVNRQTNQTLEHIAQAIFKSWFVDFEPTRAKIAAKERWLALHESVETSSPTCYAEQFDSPSQNNISLEEAMTQAAMAAISGKLIAELDQLNPERLEQFKATAALFPDALVESELGEMPEGWGMKPLSAMVELIGGGTPKKSEADYWGGDISWFSVKDAPEEGDVFVIDTEVKITELGLNKSSTKLLSKGVTIISARGTVGRLALVGVPTAMNQSCYGVQGINSIGPCLNYFNVKEAVITLQQNTHGAVFDTITRDTFDTVDLIESPVEVKLGFESLIEPLFEKIKSNLFETKGLSKIRDTLLPKLLSGEIAVIPENPAMEAAC